MTETTKEVYGMKSTPGNSGDAAPAGYGLKGGKFNCSISTTEISPLRASSMTG